MASKSHGKSIAAARTHVHVRCPERASSRGACRCLATGLYYQWSYAYTGIIVWLIYYYMYAAEIAARERRLRAPRAWPRGGGAEEATCNPEHDPECSRTGNTMRLGPRSTAGARDSWDRHDTGVTVPTQSTQPSHSGAYPNGHAPVAAHVAAASDAGVVTAPPGPSAGVRATVEKDPVGSRRTSILPSETARLSRARIARAYRSWQLRRLRREA